MIRNKDPQDQLRGMHRKRMRAGELWIQPMTLKDEEEAAFQHYLQPNQELTWPAWDHNITDTQLRIMEKRRAL